MPNDLHVAQSEICRIFTHPARIQILEILGEGERSVSDLADLTGLPQPTVSQHLSILRQAGVVDTRRAGTTIHYRIADTRILKACHVMRSVVLERLERMGERARKGKAVSGGKTRRKS